MVFGMTSAAGTEPLVRLHGKINATVFKEHWENVPNLRTPINQPTVFLQDNNPCHTVKSVKRFLSKEDVTVMEPPTQTTDINPIENV